MSSHKRSDPFAVAVLVGPKPLELERLRDLAESLGAYESGPGWFVMIDDGGPMPRGLDQLVTLPPALRPVALHHRRTSAPPAFRHGGGLCSQVLMALQWVQANTDARFLLKLDTDSLVINPFSARLARLFDASDAPAMVGAYKQTPEGLTRTWNHHAATLTRMLKPGFNWRRPIRSLKERSGPAAAAPEVVLRVVRAAMANGMDPGEHCLGGGYALSRAALDGMADAGHFADPMGWADVDLAEDVMVATHVKAVGLTLADYVRPGEVFGTRYQGLSDTLPRLVEHGYAVIHSVKNDPRFDEPTIRAFFRDRRTGVDGATDMQAGAA